jgi:hypothetical protein
MWVQVLGGAPAEMCSHYRELVVEVVVAVAVEAVAVVVLVNVGGGGWSDPLLVGCTWRVPSCEHVVTSWSDVPP